MGGGHTPHKPGDEGRLGDNVAPEVVLREGEIHRRDDVCRGKPHARVCEHMTWTHPEDDKEQDQAWRISDMKMEAMSKMHDDSPSSEPEHYVPWIHTLGLFRRHVQVSVRVKPRRVRVHIRVLRHPPSRLRGQNEDSPRMTSTYQMFGMTMAPWGMS